MKTKGKRNRRACAGESLLETLAAMLIISLAMVMLAGAVATAAKTNRAAREQVTLVERVDEAGDSISWTKTEATEKPQIRVTAEGAAVDEGKTYEVDIYTNEKGGGLSYYELPD